MKRFTVPICLVWVLLWVSGLFSAFAQTSRTGFPPFSPQAGGAWDSVNLANLNVHLRFPITEREGRGIAFSFAVNYDSSVYFRGGLNGAWLLNFGWDSSGSIGVPVGSVASSGSQQVTCSGGGTGTQSTYIGYVDIFQTFHPLVANITTNTCDGSGGTESTSDGSGYTVSVSGATNRATVTSRSGTMLAFPAGFSLPSPNNPATITDSNGNQISFNGTTITDTLGTTPLTSSGANNFPNPFSYSFPNFQGGNSTIKFSYANPAPAIQTAFQCGNILEESIPAGEEPLIDTVTLQDGSTFHLGYEPTPNQSSSVTGRLGSLRLPTGGTISYQYFGPNDGINCLDGTTMNLKRITPDGTWTYSRTVAADGITTLTTTITDPQGNQTLLHFQGGAETSRQMYQGSTTSGTLLHTVFTCYNGSKPNCDNTAVSFPVTEVSRFVKFPGDKENEQDTFIDQHSGNVMEVDEYDFGANQPGALLRKTVYAYAALGNNILDRLASITVCGPGGNDSACSGAGTSGGTKLAQSTFNYDEVSPAITSQISQHVAVSGSRGNQTTAHRWLNTINSTLDTTFTYDDTGNVLSITNPLGQKTAFAYGDCNGAFLTTATRPDTGPPVVHHVSSVGHDCNTGLKVNSTDENGQITTYSYDAMSRPLMITLPADSSGNNPKTTFSYPDANTVTVQKTITPSLTDNVTGALDGLGRTIHTFHNTPGGKVTSDVTYDVLGRAATASNPYFSTTDPTYGIRQTQYDALGRVTQVTKQDRSASRISYDNNCLTATDETGKPRRSCSDALGRLIEVDEPNAASLGTNATASVVVSGSLATANSVVDSGTVSLTTGGFTASACYGSSTNSFCSNSPVNGTAAQVASALASALNVPGSPVSATASGASINMVWNTPGPFFPSVSALTTTHDQPNLFPNPSFTGPATMFDHGTGPSLDTNPYVTLYQYDTLDNLVRMDQKGSAPADSTQWRTRTFTYDSLSQLQTATHPESGTISYFYDSNGNLLQQVSPTPNQAGAAQHTISYCYDALNRVNGKAYSWQNCQNGQLPPGTAVVSYTYDQGTNGIGHMTGLTDQSGSTGYSYDALGRLSSEQRTTSSVTKSMSYTYNLDGSIATATYPSGATITDTPDSAGRTLSVVDTGNNINYITSAVYGPHNGLTGFVSGSGNGFSGITSTTVYDVRLQPCRMTASKIGSVPTNCDNSWGELMDLRYRYNLWIGDNGNVTQIVNYRDQSRNQTFTYDPLNRLSSAQNAGTDCSVTVLGGKTKFWGNSYSYDAWGNLLGKSVTKCSAENLTLAVNANNQLQGYSYDAAGNIISDPSGNIATYDLENRLTGFGGFTYSYDASGNRVEKLSSSTNGTLYWYMAPGLVAESDSAGNLRSEYMYFNGQLVARKDFPGSAIFYYFTDQLNSASVVTDATGNIKAESDYYPWGGELQFTNGDSNRYKFTGLEHDSETNLEHAQFRQLSAPLGRWLTPDPYSGSMNLGNPQSLNRYAYVGNNPVNRTDPSGLWSPNYFSIYSYFSVGPCDFSGCGVFTGFPDFGGLGSLGLLPGEPQIPFQTLGAFLRSFLPVSSQCEFGPCGPSATSFTQQGGPPVSPGNPYGTINCLPAGVSGPPTENCVLINFFFSESEKFDDAMNRIMVLPPCPETGPTPGGGCIPPQSGPFKPFQETVRQVRNEAEFYTCAQENYGDDMGAAAMGGGFFSSIKTGTKISDGDPIIEAQAIGLAVFIDHFYEKCVPILKKP